MSFRIDWNAINKANSQELALFVLPAGFREIVICMSEWFTYEATFRVSGYDYSDWDIVQAIVARGEAGLMDGVMLSDLNGYMDRIATALEDCCPIDAINGVADAISGLELTSVSSSCCAMDKQWRTPDNWQDDWPDEPFLESDEETVEDNATLCDMAHSAHFQIGEWFQQFAGNVNEASPYTELYNFLETWQFGNPYSGWLYSLMSSIASLLYDDLLSDVDSFWEEIKDEFICKLVETSNASEFKAWLHGRVREGVPSWSSGQYMDILLTGTTFNIIYDGTYEIDPVFIGSDCEMCEFLDLPTPEGYSWHTWHIDETTLSGTRATMSYIDPLFTGLKTSTGPTVECTSLNDAPDLLIRVGGTRAVAAMVTIVDPQSGHTSSGVLLNSITGSGYLREASEESALLYYSGLEYINESVFSEFVDGFVGDVYNFSNSVYLTGLKAAVMIRLVNAGISTLTAAVRVLVKN